MRGKRGPEKAGGPTNLKRTGAGSRERKNEVYEACSSERERMGKGSNSARIIERERNGGLGEVGSKDFAPTERPRPSDVLAFCAWLSQKKEGIGPAGLQAFQTAFRRRQIEEISGTNWV